MNGAGPRLAPKPDSALPKGRSPLAHLLHALNQPLTGLQCSLELAAAGPRRPDQYIRTLTEGLELTARMRILVEALRELADLQRSTVEEAQFLPLDTLLRDTTNDLLPVAEAKSVRLLLEITIGCLYRLIAARWRHGCSAFFESILSLARDGSELQIVAKRERDRACILVSWTQGSEPESSPFTRPELGLLIAQAAWEQAGAEWTTMQENGSHTCTIRIPRCLLLATQSTVLNRSCEMSALTSMPALHHSGGALIASPNRELREQVAHHLNGRCRPVQQASGGADALSKLEKGGWQILFLDRRLPDLDAEELIALIQRRFPEIQVVMLDSDDARTDCDDKDAGTPDRCHAIAPHSGESRGIAQITVTEPLPGMLGSSEVMQRVYRMTRLVASRTTTVLVAGPTGTGKELVARALHALSPRSAKPLVVVNCAAIPEALLESELFGYTRGAFTGAVQSQLGTHPSSSRRNPVPR